MRRARRLRAAEERIGLTVVGPEAPLAAGIVDDVPRRRPAHLRSDPRGRAARELEGLRQGLHGSATAFRPPPTAASRDAGAGARLRAPARRADRRQGRRPGGRQGRGRRADARPRRTRPIDAMLGGSSSGDGRRARRDRGFPRRRGGQLHRAVRRPARAGRWPPRQDHKRLRDGDEGPNTGGMGAYSPAPVVTPAIHARVMREIIDADDRRAWRPKASPTPASCTPA